MRDLTRPLKDVQGYALGKEDEKTTPRWGKEKTARHPYKVNPGADGQMRWADSNSLQEASSNKLQDEWTEYKILH